MANGFARTGQHKMTIDLHKKSSLFQVQCSLQRNRLKEWCVNVRWKNSFVKKNYWYFSFPKMENPIPVFGKLRVYFRNIRIQLLFNQWKSLIFSMILWKIPIIHDLSWHYNFHQFYLCFINHRYVFFMDIRDWFYLNSAIIHYEVDHGGSGQKNKIQLGSKNPCVLTRFSSISYFFIFLTFLH